MSITVAEPAGSGLRPAIASGSMMFSTAVSVGMRLNDWKMKPMLVAPQQGEVLVASAR